MLNIDNLSVSVNKKNILDKISLCINPEELHVLMGPNGSGKSSLAMTLLGHPLYKVLGGTVQLADNNLLNMPMHERAKLGLFVSFQNPVEFEGISVQSFLKTAYENMHGKLTSILEFRELLQQKAVDIGLKPELLLRSLNQGFSGGEKKRLELLQLAVLKPRFAILDELDSGLDMDALKHIAQHIHTLQKQCSLGILFITHYPRMLKVLELTKLHVMVSGKVVATGGKQLAQELEEKGFAPYLKT